MLQRGLLTNAGQQQPPYETTTTTRKTSRTATSAVPSEANLQHREQELLSSNKVEFNELMGQQQQQKERLNCLPIIEMPQIKIEQDIEEYMDDQEEGNNEEEEEEGEQQQYEQQDQADIEQYDEPMDTDDTEERGIKPLPQLLEPTSILKTSLLTGAANTLATLTAAAEQIARMPNESLNKSYAYLREENRRTYSVGSTHDRDKNKEQESERVKEKEKDKEETETHTNNTYTSILQTALMAKRPANLNVTAAGSAATTKTLHVRTPDQVLKTAVTLATLSEIAAQQEQQQQLQQQKNLQPHILVVPQMTTPMRKMCTLPFKKLNFANVTTSSTSSLSATTSIASSSATATTSNTASSINTTITNANYTLGSNFKTTTTTIVTNNNNKQQQAASNNNNLSNSSSSSNIINNNNSSNSNSNNNGTNNNNLKTQAIATQTLKIPQPQLHAKPQLVTSQTQTEEQVVGPHHTSNTGVVVEHTANSSSNISLTRTAVPVPTKVLVQNSSTSSSSTSSSALKTSSATISLNTSKITPLNTPHIVGETKSGHIFNYNAQTSGKGSGSSSSSSSTSKELNTLTKMNIIKSKSISNSNRIGNESATNTATASTTPAATNVTVVVFETLLPED